MNKIFLAIALLMATPSLAQSNPIPPANTPGFSKPIPVRYEFVFQIADRGFCRRVSAYFNDTSKLSEEAVAAKFLEAKTAFRLTDAESTILINQCLSYQQGWNDRNEQ